jgi:IS30 family transposase
LSYRAIARTLGRPASTVSREVAANGGTKRYRAARADQSAWGRAARPKTCRLTENPLLRAIVEEKLARRWSPQQIAGWLKVTHPNDPEMQVSHESIYRTLYVQSRGALRRELTAYLRTGPGDPAPERGAATRWSRWSAEHVAHLRTASRGRGPRGARALGR